MGKKPQGKKTSAASEPRITFAELISKIGIDKVTEEEIGRYFFSTHPRPGDYVPRLAINTTTVDVGDKETLAREVGNDLGYKAVEAVRQAKLLAAGAPKPDGTIVAEGDSWFNLPEFGFPINVPPTLVDILAIDRPINNIAHWGDTLAQIVNAAEYVSYLKTKKVTHFLFSAGGNDILGGGHLADFLRQRESGDNDPKNAPKYINPLFDKSLNDVMFLYEMLIENIRQLSPQTTILIHGYDYCLPVPRGPWLGDAMESRGFLPIDNKAICRAIIKEMLKRFNQRLADIAKNSNGRVRYVSLLDTVKDAWWDELHPNKTAVKRLAKEFDKQLP